MSEIRLPGYCPLCISRCGIVSVVEGGVLKRVEPLPGHPTGRSLCIKGKAAPQLVHHAERLLQPLKRTRPKGAPDPGWEPISWDAALAIAAERLLDIARSDGPEAVAFSVTTPSGTAVNDGMALLFRLANLFGSPNLHFTTHVCNWHRDNATRFTTGAETGMPDFERCRALVLWGFNPVATWPAFAERVRAAQKRGCRLIVVDPRRSGLAAGADLWLPVRPGTDGALALALLNRLIDSGALDREFIASATNGPFLVAGDDGRVVRREGRPLVWDESCGRAVRAEEARSPALTGSFEVESAAGTVRCRPAFALLAESCRAFTPGRAAAETGVAARLIEATAQLLAEHAPVGHYAWAGVNQGGNVTQTSRAMSLLFALLGGFDAPGGNRHYWKPPLGQFAGFELLPRSQRDKRLGLAQRPLGPASGGFVTEPDLWRAVLDERPYPVRALVAFGSNPLLSRPDPARGAAALRKLRFHLHADLFVNESAAFADLLLPVASPWEREGVCAGFQLDAAASAHLQLRPRAIEPLGECRSDLRIALDLAQHLGLRDPLLNSDEETVLARMLEPSGITPAQLRDRPEGITLTPPTSAGGLPFATPSGRIEIYSEALLASGQPALPEFVAPARAAAFPLLLTSAKVTTYCHSQFRRVETLRRRLPEPLVEIHPATAAEVGVNDGDRVRVISPFGEMVAQAALTPRMRADTVVGHYGWPDAGNYARLVGLEGGDPISGSLPLRGGICRLEPVGAEGMGEMRAPG